MFCGYGIHRDKWDKTVKGKDCIVFDFSLIEFMKNFSDVVKKALGYALAVHLEKNNLDAKHIATKIDIDSDIEIRLDKIKNLDVRSVKNNPKNFRRFDEQGSTPTRII